MKVSAAAVDATPRSAHRWALFACCLLGATMTVLDNTVLTVSIPEIMRDLDTDVAGVQWIFTGYALTFASLLVIGGRLGDIYGPRRIFMLGITLFGVGSLIASEANSMPQMIIGEAVIEGAGAALLVPSTMSILARTFSGRDRNVAFAAYAATIGAAATFGPLIGGYLTTYHSWRWCFRINVILFPIVVVVLLRTSRGTRSHGSRQRLDLTGAALIGSGMFLAVFGLTQGNGYGWWKPLQGVAVGGVTVWPERIGVSITPVAFLLAALLLGTFVRFERSLEAQDAHPLFELSQFRHRTFRYTGIATFCLAFAQLGSSLCIALYLQESRGLSPVRTGLWLLPMGASILGGAPFGGLLARHTGATNTLRVGMAVHLAGILGVAWLLADQTPYAAILPAFLLYGFSGGIVSSQMNQVMLHDIAPEHTGAASGVNTTARQAATALGVAATGAIFAAVSADRGVGAALRPALLLAAVAVALSAALMWKLPQLGRDAAAPLEGAAALQAVVEPVSTRIEA
jgi:EmrB/QacA subfamily drug resistance transporter